MNYQTKLISGKGYSLIIPVFTQEKQGEDEYSRRMNDFYSELERSIIAFCKSEEFPKGAKYYAKASVTERENELFVDILLRLREGAEIKREKLISHLWKNGVIISKSSK